MRKATVVGAGLVGSLWAVLLRQRGFDVEMFERRSDPRALDAGAGRSINLVMTSRGLHALEKAGLLKKALELAVPVFGRGIHPKSGPMTLQPYGQANECNHSISRLALNRFLLDEAEARGVKIRFGHSLEELNPETKRLRFTTADGTAGAVEHGYDLLFGTDGAGSQVRHQLAARLPADLRERTDWLEADYKELTLPRAADGSPRLPKDSLHIWPRGAHMMMALANLDGSFTATIYLPKTGSPVAFDRLKTANDVARLRDIEFPGADALMPDFVEEFMANPQGHLGTVHVSRWVHGDSIALMGDAAHAIVPFFGQGMNAGFEDCTRMLECLDRAGDDWGRVLADYERTQKPNADAIAAMALENWVEMRDKVADSRFQLRKKVEGLLEQRHPGIYKSRYGLITYTLTPYLLAQKAGLKQDEMLGRLIQGKDSVEQIDWREAERLLESEWTPFLKENPLDLRRYEPGV